MNLDGEPNGLGTTPPAQMKMTVFLLYDSDMRCLLVSAAQLQAIVSLLDVELEVLTA